MEPARISWSRVFVWVVFALIAFPFFLVWAFVEFARPK